jgi:hypothetical protein
MPDYTAKGFTYRTIQNDMWDIVALREYGDEHAMNFVQDDNYDERFTDAFPGGVNLNIVPAVTVGINLKAANPAPPLSQLLPWR